MATVLRIWVEYSNAAKQYASEPIKLCQQMDAIQKRELGQATPSNIAAQNLFPLFSQAGKAVVREEAVRLVGQAFVKALLIHARTGRFPTELDQIPGKWIDPFTSKPLHFDSDGTYLRIYSVGPTGKDHGGKSSAEVSEEQRKAMEYDLVAEYPPVPEEGA